MRNDQGMWGLCDQICHRAFDLHAYLRNGHLEKVYENGMAYRLRKTGLAVQRPRAPRVRDEDGAILLCLLCLLWLENIIHQVAPDIEKGRTSGLPAK